MKQIKELNKKLIYVLITPAVLTITITNLMCAYIYVRYYFFFTLIITLLAISGYYLIKKNGGFKNVRFN